MKTNNKTIGRLDLRVEILDDFEHYDIKDSQYHEDIVAEVADSLTPVYNTDLIDFASNYVGEEFWELWLDNSEYTNPIDCLRWNVYNLYLQVANDVLEELREEWEEDN